MSVETFLEIWTRHYDTLDEYGRVMFLLKLKQMREEGNDDAGNALHILVHRWEWERPK